MKRRSRGALAAATAVLLGFVAAIGGIAAPAYAADGDVLIEKSASTSTVVPGQTFTYQIAVNCTSILAGCTGATITDTVPAPFILQSASVGTGLDGDVTITGNTVDVAFTSPVGAGQGIPAGTTGVVTVTVLAPADMPYEYDGVDIPNTATSDADTQTSGPLDSTAVVTPDIQLDLATTVSKTMSPPSAVASPGTPVTSSITAGNDSNANVDTITITDPPDPTAPGNPFDSLPYTGIGTVTYPDGADHATIELYSSATGGWVSGAEADAPDQPVPPSVADEDVIGVRIVFTDDGGDPIAPGAVGGIEIGMEHPDDVASLPDNLTVTNTAEGTVALGPDAESSTDDATHVIVAEDIDIVASKTFSPDQVAAGEPSTVTITAGNDSAFPLTDFSVIEPSATGSDLSADGFDASMSFDGFTSGIDYPDDATSASVTYYYDDGTTQTVSFADGATPAPPSGSADVARFSVDFVGEIQSGQSTDIEFRVISDENETAFDPPAEVPNEVTVAGTGPGGGRTDTTASDILQVFGETLDIIAGKSLYPNQILDNPGEWVLVSLPTELAPFPDSTTGADQIIVQDPPAVPYPVDGTWWDSFDATAITQTAVPGDSTLSINYWNGSAWVPLPGAQNIVGPQIFTMDIPPALSSQILGLQFVYTSTDPDGFPPGTSLEPHFTSELRPTERDTTTELTPPDTIANCASASAAAGGTSTSAASPCPSVTVNPSDPDGADILDKEFLPTADGTTPTVSARSGEQVTGVIRWSTGGFAGVERMVIDDVDGAETLPIEDSFYNAFNLVRVEGIDATADPYLQYDQIESVQYWNGTAWVTFTNSPCPCLGSFPGFDLTAAEQEAALGVRFVYSERPDRGTVFATDPQAPPVGSGVARSSGNDRSLQLTFAVRDLVRSPATPPTPALGSLEYNVVDGDPALGTVRNTASATGYAPDNSVFIDTVDSDDALIVDVPLNVSISKNWAGGPMGVPPETPAVDPDNYPIGRVTVRGINQTAAKVDQLVLTDPDPAAGASPTSFSYFDLDDVVSISRPGGATTSTVNLFMDNTGDGIADLTVPQTIAFVVGMTATQLENVVGIQVVHEGRINAGAGTTITMDMQLRKYVRGTGDPGTLVTAADHSPVLNTSVVSVDDLGGTAADVTEADDSAAMVLGPLDFSVIADKQFSVASQTEPDDSIVTMTLTGQPQGSVRANRMLVTDTDPSFWNAWDFVGIDPGATATAPIDRVRMDVLTGPAFQLSGTDIIDSHDEGDWITGETLSFADFILDPLPTGVAAEDVQGIRFTYTDSAGGQWDSPTPHPSQSMPVLVQRRDTLRTGGAVPSDLPALEPAPGETVKGQYTNDMDARAYAVIGGGLISVDEAAQGEIVYEHATTSVDIQKAPDAGQFAPDTVIPFTITVENTGELPIIDPVIVDDIPAGGALVFDPDPAVDPADAFSYAFVEASPPAAQTGPQMPVDPAQVTVTQLDDGAGDLDSLTFTFPSDTRLEPGQRYTITVELIFAAGTPAGATVENVASITGERQFDECGNDDGTTPGPLDDCADSALVEVTASGAVRSGKMVRVADDELGQFDVLAGGDCSPDTAPVLYPDGETTFDFFRAPCVPIAKPGSTVDWRMAIVNTGNIPMNKLVMIDALPTPGDQGILSGLPRESRWDAIFSGAAPVLAQAPTGAVMSFEVTTGTVCTDDLADTTAIPSPCTGWVDPSGVDPADVTGIKVSVELPADTLLPGDRVLVDFTTTTAAFSPADEPRTGTADENGTIAWNTVATGAHLTQVQTAGGEDMSPIEGTKVGVALANGELQILKTVTGDGADEWAPNSFEVELVCTSATEDVPITNNPFTVTAGTPTTVVDLPWGAECTVEEGDNGQTSSGGQTSATALDPARGSPLPTIETATLVNDYELAGLTVSKTVQSDAVDQDGTPVGYGPFTVDVTCLYLGEEVWGDGYTASPMELTLAGDGGSGSSDTITGLPAGADCTVAESETMDAVTTEITGSTGAGPVTPGDASGVDLTLTPDAAGSPTNTAAILNTYGVGSLTIDKALDVPVGAEDYVGGPYIVHVRCVLDDASGSRVVWEDDVTFDGAAPNDGFTVTIDDIAAGAVCSAVETDNGLAESSTITGSPATIIDGGTATITVTNEFTVGRVEVHKELTGDPEWAGDEYTVSLACVDFDGGTSVITVPGGPQRTINADGTVESYDPLPTGAFCVLREIDSGDADSSTVINDATGNPAGIFRITDGGTVSLTVENDFVTGQIEVTKTSSGDGAGIYDTEDYEVSLSCTATIEGVNGPIAIPGGATRILSLDGAPADATAVYEHLPPGAECGLTETGAGGASAVTITPNDGTDTTTGIAVVDADSPVEITVDNRFDVGEITVTKTLSGAGQEWAVGEFDISLSCVWQGNPVDPIPGGADRTLSTSTSMSTTYSGLPDGASCTVTEVDDAGAAGTTIAPNNGVVTVDPDTTVEVTVDNEFTAGDIHVVKTVSGDAATMGAAGDFTVTLACTATIAGVPDTVISIPGGADRVLNAANGYEADYLDLPPDAECTLSETNSGGATNVVLTPATGTVDVVENDTVTIGVENVFDAGSLAIDKTVDGDGAPYFGNGPFTMHVRCTLATEGDDRVVYDEDVVLLEADSFQAQIDDIPVGSECSVVETDNGVADESTVTGSPATIGDGTVVTVDAVNTFLSGSLIIEKVVTGGGAELYGAGPFEVTVRCIDFDLDGSYRVDIPGGATRILDASNDYTVEYEVLPAGALCGVAETDDGGADAKRLLDENGDEVGLITLASGSRAGFFVVRDASVHEFTLENTFDPPLPVTGGSLPWGLLWAAAILTIGGAGMLTIRRIARAG